MFTVKHQDSVGNVWLRDCANVDIEAEDGMVCVKLRDEAGKEIAFRNGWPTGWPTNVNAEDEMDMIYVMNAQGSTIHSLKLRVSAACSFGRRSETLDHASACGPAESPVSRAA